MKSMSISNARQDLFNIVDETIKHSDQFRIMTKAGNAILVSEDDWNAIQETLYLLSVPGMREKLIEGKNTSVEDCVKDIGWNLD